MGLDHFVQQERFLTRGDEFAIANSPNCHKGMWGCAGVVPFVQHSPLRVSLEPGDIAGEIYLLAARRDRSRVGSEPSWSGLMWSVVPLVFDFPTLRLGVQFPCGSDEHGASAPRKKRCHPFAELLTGRQISVFHSPID